MSLYWLCSGFPGPLDELWARYEDPEELRLSTPCLVHGVGRAIPVLLRGVCLARCTYVMSLEPWIRGKGYVTARWQCGGLGRPAPDGRLLCPTHYALLWLCDLCAVVVSEEGAGWCSGACEETYRMRETLDHIFEEEASAGDVP